MPNLMGKLTPDEKLRKYLFTQLKKIEKEIVEIGQRSQLISLENCQNEDENNIDDIKSFYYHTAVHEQCSMFWRRLRPLIIRLSKEQE